MCSETFQNVPAVYNSVNGEDIQCEFCEKVIQHWVDTWTANTTEEEFKTVLESLCKKLDKPSRVSHCLHIVDDWYLPWFNYLLHEIQPKELCGFVGLCKQTDVVHIPLTRLSAANRLAGDDEANYHAELNANIAQGREYNKNFQTRARLKKKFCLGLIGGYFAPKTVVETSKPGCAICEYTLHELQDFLGDGKTEGEIEAGLRQICSHLPHSVEGQCDHFVNTYAPALVQLLIHEVDPSEICSRLDLCAADLLAAQASAATPALQMLRRETESCALCEYGLDAVLSTLNDTSNQEMVKNALDQMCYKLMPHSLRNECEKLVSEYTNRILDLIVRDFSADEICSKIRLCTGDKFEVTSEAEEEEDTDLVVTTADDEGSLEDTYFLLYHPDNPVWVWLDVDTSNHTGSRNRGCRNRCQPGIR